MSFSLSISYTRSIHSSVPMYGSLTHTYTYTHTYTHKHTHTNTHTTQSYTHIHTQTLGAALARAPSKNLEAPMHLSVFTTFPPKMWVPSLNIFEKFTPVHTHLHTPTHTPIHAHKEGERLSDRNRDRGKKDKQTGI